MRDMGAHGAGLPLSGRVVVRQRLPEPDAFGHTLTDVVGEVVAVEDEAITVRTRHGEVRVPRGLIVTSKALPPRASRRGAAHRSLSVAGMQEVMLGAWGALEREWLGRWQLRAGAGYTMRANSVALLGDPGLPLTDAVARARHWYAVRSLPLNVTLAGPVGFAVEDDPLGILLLDRGATRAERCLTMTADGTDVVRALSIGQDRSAGPTVEVSDTLGDDWLDAHRGYRSTSRLSASGSIDDRWAATARVILTGSPGQLFALARDTDGSVVALGRAGLTPAWTGLASIWVHPEHRRRGLAQRITHALLVESLRRGHRWAHLQVLSDNAPARALYEAMGFQPHHDYVNLIEERP